MMQRNRRTAGPIDLGQNTTTMGLTEMHSMTLAIRPAAVAGAFYPGDARTLRAAVAAHLARADSSAVTAPAAPCPKLLVVPHAGYVYSGDVAAHAYRLLAPHRDTVRRVVLLGPAHRVPVRGLAAPTVAAFDTPLGHVPLDRAAIDSLADLPQVRRNDRAHAQEHALEVQLPFLQAVLAPGFTLVPLAVGDATPAEVAMVLERLWGGPETVVLISSDLSHYLPDALAKARDAVTVDRLMHGATDLAGDEACGAQALNGAMVCARRHRLVPQRLEVRNSADAAGRGHERVVGYAAIAFLPATPSPGVANAASSANSIDSGTSIDPSLGRSLLASARAAIAGRLNLPAPPVPPHPALAQPGACFVTLHDAQGRLRGCIGRLDATRALGADVQSNAIAAAFGDSRFPPVSSAEWHTLRLEVSVLTPMQPLPPTASQAEAAAVLQPGRDGVVLEWQGHRGTFLPQVWAQLPEPRLFLRQLLAKAGLPSDFWSSEVQLSRYQVQAWTDAQEAHDASP